MKLTKVEAGSMQEALRKIRSTLGDEAQIVGTRSFKKGGLLGVGGQEVVEVYVTDPRPRARAAGDGRGAVAAAPAPAIGAVPAAATAEAVGRPESVEALSKALADLREEVRSLVREKEDQDHPFLRDAQALLIEREVSPKLASRIIDGLRPLPLPLGIPDPSRVRAVVAAAIRKLFLPNVPFPPANPRVVILVGPTGVGKTTTIAKMAARSKLSEGRKVSLITLDTFRIAAVDQLQKYAGIIGIPLAIASDPVEYLAAARTFAREGSDTIFVDTAGRSQRDEMKMTELKEFLGSLPGAEVHLVLSATTGPRTVRSVVDRFGEIGFHRVILTKLDEATSFGALVEPLLEIGKPVSYLTDGQNVPDDIMMGDPERLAELVFRSMNG